MVSLLIFRHNFELGRQISNAVASANGKSPCHDGFRFFLCTLGHPPLNMGALSQHINCLTGVQRQVLIFSPCKMCKHHVASEHEHSMSDSHLIFELLSRHIIWKRGYHGIPQFPAKIRWKFAAVGIPTISTHTLAVRWRSLGHGKLTKRKRAKMDMVFGCFWSVHPGIR